jgi:hypothetical protein
MIFLILIYFNLIKNIDHNEITIYSMATDNTHPQVLCVPGVPTVPGVPVVLLSKFGTSTF